MPRRIRAPPPGYVVKSTHPLLIYLLFCIVAIIKQYADFNANRLNELQTTFFCALSKASLYTSIKM